MKNREHITSGSIVKTVLSLAMPVVAGMFMEFALHITDFYWVGKLGASAQDAVTSSMVVIWTMFAIISIISIGITALVSRFVGAKDMEKASFYTRQGFVMALIIGLLLSIIGYFVTPQMLRFMATGESTLLNAIPYLRISFGFAFLFFILETVYAIFRAVGDTKTPMMIGITTVLLNITLDPMLIFGWLGIPQMGVAGAAVATGLSGCIATVWATILLMRGKAGFIPGNLLTVRPQLSELFRIARIGLPISSQQMVFVVVYWFLIKYVHQFGESAGAAMGIGNRMESISYLTCYGFSVAASTMVGQNLGAGKADRAASCAWGSMGVAIALTSVISMLFLTIPNIIAGVFTNDPEVLSIASDYLIILGLSQVTMAIEIVLEGAFGGAGDTIPPMVVSVPGSLARIPLAYYLCFTLDWGLNGIWWTLTITTIVKACALIIWFARGKWKMKKV